MPEAGLDALMPQLRALVSAGHYKDLSDGNLLERFVAHRDELAFKTLVRRHGPLILGVCRRVLGAGPDIDDVFQATFLVLASKAGTIRRQASVAGWLYGVAFRLSQKLRKRRNRQRKLEHATESLEAISETSQMGSDPALQASLHELGAILDEEVQRLPAKYRETFVLCHIEGLSAVEAAKRLDCPLPTLKSRLMQARELIRQRLVRRGVTMSITGVAALFAGQSARAAVPHKVVVAALQAALAYATKPVACSVVSAQAAALAQGFLKTMTITKLSLVLVAVLTVTVLGFGAARSPDQSTDKVVPQVDANPLLVAAVQPPQIAKVQQREQTLRVVVTDSQGKPLANAEIHASIWTDEKDFKANREYQTDATGTAKVELPKTINTLRLWANKELFASLFVNWEANELASGTQLPSEYAIRLEPAVYAGGRIVDEQGKPIVGAKVQVSVVEDIKPANSDGRARYETTLAHGQDSATTDAEGRWRIANVPNHPHVELMLFVSHPDYVSDHVYGGIQKAAGATTAMLRDEKATLTLKRGVIVHGKVTDPAGNPIKDAVVVLGDDPYMSRLTSKFPAGDDGQFKLPALAPQETTLTVIAPGWAPQSKKVAVKPGLAPQDFLMASGKPIRLQIIDGAGRPIPHASVYILEWNGSKSIQTNHNPNHPKVPDNKIPRKADADGIWEWTSAPDGTVKLGVFLKGYTKSELRIAGGAPECTVTLNSEHRITGRVTDAVTGKPIPVFTVIPIDIFAKDHLSAERSHAEMGKDGVYSFVPFRNDVPLRVRIEAVGYRTQDGPESKKGDETERTQDFKLTPSDPLIGFVLDAAGKPLANAEVQLATPTEHASITSSDFSHKTFTDAAGRFVFPDPGEPCAVLVQAANGYAHAEFPAGQHDLGKFKLQAWASVRGTFSDGGKSVSGATIFLRPSCIDGLDRPSVDNSLQTVTGADGSFEFPLVPPGPVSVRVHLGPWKDEGFRSGPAVPIVLQPGQRADLVLGRDGTVVKGKVKLAGKVPAGLDCTYSINFLVRREPGIAPPADIANLGFDVRNGWRQTWRQSAEGLGYLSTLRYWFVKLSPDGAFQISGVPPGEYDLAIEIYARTGNCLVDPLAHDVVRVTVTTADVARGELTLPEISAAVTPVPEVGDTPVLAFQRPDNTAGTLADNRGHYTVVHFWASWCGACKKHLPALQRLQEQFAARGLTTLGLSLDDDVVAWHAALKKLDLPLQQGRLATASTLGVSGVPMYWLIDPAGTIVAKVYDPDELGAILAKLLK